MTEVTILVKRAKDEIGKAIVLKEVGESKKGNYKLYSPATETPDLPGFCKVYVKAHRSKK